MVDTAHMTDTPHRLHPADADLLEFPMARSCPMAPPDQYAALRELPPQRVAFAGGTWAWIITRHHEVRAALTDPRLSVDQENPGFPQRMQIPTIPRAMSFWRMDEPEHGRLRQMVTPEFTAHAVKRLRPQIEQLVDELLDQLQSGPRPVDLVRAFALPLPCLVIARIFGVPDEDLDFFSKVSQGVLAVDTTEQQAHAAYGDMTRYLDQLIQQRTIHPRNDLLSRLARDHVATGQLTHDDLVAMARLVLVAGHEIIANQLALSVIALIRHPIQLAEILADPALIPGAVDELLRFWSVPEDNIVRVALEDVTVGEIKIAKGEGVILAFAAANHDEQVFPNAARLDIHRDASRHITFGEGPHRCPGGPLTSLELEIALPKLFARLPNLHLAVDFDDLEFRFPTLVYGVRSLPVSW